MDAVAAFEAFTADRGILALQALQKSVDALAHE
jgi:hypothetical protein